VDKWPKSVDKVLIATRRILTRLKLLEAVVIYNTIKEEQVAPAREAESSHPKHDRENQNTSSDKASEGQGTLPHTLWKVLCPLTCVQATVEGAKEKAVVHLGRTDVEVQIPLE
jgi:hypothetical protein